MEVLLGDNGQLFGWSERFWLLFDQAGTLLGNLLMLFSLGAAVLGFFKREKLRRWLHRNTFPEVGGEDIPQDRDSLVFTFSREDLPRWVVTRLRPKWVGLVPSQETRAAAERLKRNLEANGILVRLHTVDDPDDPGLAQIAVRELIHKARTEGFEHPAVDVTGGKVPMSLGAFMAAEEAGVPTFYVTSEYDRESRRVRPGSQRIVNVSIPV